MKKYMYEFVSISLVSWFKANLVVYFFQLKKCFQIYWKRSNDFSVNISWPWSFLWAFSACFPVPWLIVSKKAMTYKLGTSDCLGWNTQHPFQSIYQVIYSKH